MNDEDENKPAYLAAAWFIIGLSVIVTAFLWVIIEITSY